MVWSLPPAMYVTFRSVQATQDLQSSQPSFLWDPKNRVCKSRETWLLVDPNPERHRVWQTERGALLPPDELGTLHKSSYH